MTTIMYMSRRDIIIGGVAAGLVLSFYVGSKFSIADAATAKSFASNVYVAIDESGLVTIVAHRSEWAVEFGPGCPWYLPMSSKPTGRVSRSCKPRATRNMAIRIPMVRAAPGNSINRCARPERLHDKCLKLLPRKRGESTRSNPDDPVD